MKSKKKPVTGEAPVFVREIEFKFDRGAGETWADLAQRYQAARRRYLAALGAAAAA